MNPRKVAAVMAVFGAVVLALGAGLVYLPAGLIAAGLELVGGAYVVAYLGRAR